MLYSCFDFRFSSEIPLGELTPAEASDQREIVSIRRGEAPETLPGAGAPQLGVQATADEALLSVPTVGRYWVQGGREVVVDPLPEASGRNVRLFLLGSALGILAYQRGLLPLHANAIVVDGAAYAFSGPSGAGKSTLAAHFAAAGYPVLCDDVCAVSFDADGVPHAWPGLPRLKLWEDAARSFGHDPEGLDRAIEGHEKFHVPIATLAPSERVPLRRLYTLARAEEEAQPGIVRLHGQDAMRAAMENTYRGEYLGALGRAKQQFGQAVALIRNARIYAVTRRWGYDVFDQEAVRLLTHIANDDG